MTRPLSSLHDGLTPDERARYEAAQVDPPEVPAPQAAKEPEPLGNIFTKLAARGFLKVPKHTLHVLPPAPKPGPSGAAARRTAPIEADGTTSAAVMKDSAERIERMKQRAERPGFGFRGTGFTGAVGHAGRHLEASCSDNQAKEAGE